VNDFLDEKRREITSRLQELKPMVDEYSRLEAAAAALDSVRKASPASATAKAAPRRRGPGRPRGSASRKKAATAAKPAAKKPARKAARKPVRKPVRKTVRKAARKTAARPAAGRRRAGRRKGSGTRAAEALTFVKGQPGITIPELAAKMGIKQNYLYRVLPGLEQESKVTKKGRGWHSKG
jgi:hypothetical protein